MATKANSTKAPRPTYRQVAGTKANPATPYRALRQAKGYGRVACANALGITTTVLWQNENHVPASTPAGKAALAALRALPNLGKATGVVATPATPAKPAKPAKPTPAALA